MSSRDVAQLRLGFERIAGAQSCRNLMGKVSYYGSAYRNRELVALWSQREDCLLWVDCGVFHGHVGVEQYYLKMVGDRDLPEKLEVRKGTMEMHALDTQVLYVAGDGNTARGCWISPGHETHVEDGKPQPHWCWQKYQADFIKEENVWKIWKLRVMPLFYTPYDTCWVDTPQKRVPTAVGAEPVPRETYSYGPDVVYPADEPWIPVPYETYADLPDIFV